MLQPHPSVSLIEQIKIQIRKIPATLLKIIITQPAFLARRDSFPTQEIEYNSNICSRMESEYCCKVLLPVLVTRKSRRFLSIIMMVEEFQNK